MNLQEHFENFKNCEILFTTPTSIGLGNNSEYTYYVSVTNSKYLQNPDNFSQAKQVCFNVVIHKRGVPRTVDVKQLLEYLDTTITLEDWTNHLTSSGKLLDYIKDMRENTKKRLLAELESL